MNSLPLLIATMVPLCGCIALALLLLEKTGAVAFETVRVVAPSLLTLIASLVLLTLWRVK